MHYTNDSVYRKPKLLNGGTDWLRGREHPRNTLGTALIGTASLLSGIGISGGLYFDSLEFTAPTKCKYLLISTTEM